MPRPAVSIAGEVKIYDRAADSGNIVSRAFCAECGSPIYSLNDAMPGLVFIRASSLDDLEVFKPQMIVYAGRGASWDLLDTSLARFEKMPPMEQAQASIAGTRPAN